MAGGAEPPAYRDQGARGRIEEMTRTREKALFEAALKLPSVERAAFLQGSCAGDEALRREVADLLRHHEEAEGFLEALPAAAERPISTDETKLNLGVGHPFIC